MENPLHEHYQQEKKELGPDIWRFLLDLEFVQCLANPNYIKFLSLHEAKYFSEPRFIAYLKYLNYWKSPGHIQFISYPHCLFMLDQLQREEFRNELKNPAAIDRIYQQQLFSWRHYRQQHTSWLLPQDATNLDAGDVESVD